MPTGVNETAVWQQVEFGSYVADLSVWADLAAEIGSPVIELGSGAGRVALHLAERGHEVVALERDPELLDALERSTEAAAAPIHVLKTDLASPAGIHPPVRPVLAIGPLHVIQLVDPSARPALLDRLRALIAVGGCLAMTLVDEESMRSARPSSTRILPDMRELDGWVYSSEPLWIQVSRDALTVRRVRERVSPTGEMNRSIHDETLHRVSPAALEREAERVGLRPAPRRRISYGPDEADSTIVLLEVPA